MSEGELTAHAARFLIGLPNLRDFEVLFDHGDPSIDPPGQLGNISSWFGDRYDYNSQLALLDIAVIDRRTDKAIALIEIEETSANPKTIFGDAFGTLMGDHITFHGKRRLSVGEFTTLIILFRQKAADRTDRLIYLREQIEALKPCIRSGNASIGRLVMDTYLNGTVLEQKLNDIVSACLDGYSGIEG